MPRPRQPQRGGRASRAALGPRAWLLTEPQLQRRRPPREPPGGLGYRPRRCRRRRHAIRTGQERTVGLALGPRSSASSEADVTRAGPHVTRRGLVRARPPVRPPRLRGRWAGPLLHLGVEGVEGALSPSSQTCRASARRSFRSRPAR